MTKAIKPKFLKASALPEISRQASTAVALALGTSQLQDKPKELDGERPVGDWDPRQVIDPLLSDADLALRLRISRSWVRKQRMLMRAGMPHVLTVAPVMIGSCPRYLSSEIEAWVSARSRVRSTADKG